MIWVLNAQKAGCNSFSLKSSSSRSCTEPMIQAFFAQLEGK